MIKEYKIILLLSMLILPNAYLITTAKLCRICYSKLTIFNISKNKFFKSYDNYIYINEPKTKSICYIFYNKNKIDICFKGTSTTTDICFNLDIYPSLYINNKIRIHNGFLKKYLSLKNNIINNINNIIKNREIKEISFNGYSSGGAIANIASLDMSYIYNNITIKCITFGSPRVGNEEFTKTYNSKILNSIRIINKNDIIPHVPPPIIYKHVHTPLILENKNKSYSSYNIYKYFKYTHSIITYIRNLY